MALQNYSWGLAHALELFSAVRHKHFLRAPSVVKINHHTDNNHASVCIFWQTTLFWVQKSEVLLHSTHVQQQKQALCASFKLIILDRNTSLVTCLQNQKLTMGTVSSCWLESVQCNVVLVTVYCSGVVSYCPSPSIVSTFPKKRVVFLY